MLRQAASGPPLHYQSRPGSSNFCAFVHPIVIGPQRPTTSTTHNFHCWVWAPHPAKELAMDAESSVTRIAVMLCTGNRPSCKEEAIDSAARCLDLYWLTYGSELRSTSTLATSTWYTHRGHVLDSLRRTPLERLRVWGCTV